MSIEVSSIEIIEDPTDAADPRSPKKRQSLIRAMILRQTTPEYLARVVEVVQEEKEIDEVVPNAEAKLSRRKTTLNNAPNTGDISKVEAAEAAEKEAQKELEAAPAIAKLRREVARGDFPPEEPKKAEPREDLPPLEFGAVEPYPLPRAPVNSSNSTPAVADTTAFETQPAPEKARSPKKPSIETVALTYMREEYKAGQFASAAKFHKHLWIAAGKEKSPFEMGTGTNSRKLFCPEAGSFFDVGTLGKIWPKIRA